MDYSIHIEQFDGPLDLLLHLINDAKIDIEDVFVSEITSQYLSYMSELDRLDMDAASEFISIAATLLYMKSKQMLPRTEPETEEEEDPGERLIRQLHDYRLFKEASARLYDRLSEADESFTKLPEDVLLPPPEFRLTNATIEGLREAFLEILKRNAQRPDTDRDPVRAIRADAFTVRNQIGKVRSALRARRSLSFDSLFEEHAGRMEIIVTFMALLEMLAHGELSVRQERPFAPITIQAADLKEDDSEEYDLTDQEGNEYEQ